MVRVRLMVRVRGRKIVRVRVTFVVGLGLGLDVQSPTIFQSDFSNSLFSSVSFPSTLPLV